MPKLLPNRRALAGTAVALLFAAATLAGCGSTPPASYFTQERRISDELVAQVHDGMTREQVRALLGGPARIAIDRFTGLEEWLWRYTKVAIYEMCFYARFDDQGRVAGTSTMVESQKSDYDSFKPC